MSDSEPTLSGPTPVPALGGAEGKPNSVVIQAPVPKPARRRQFPPGARVKDSRGQIYRVDARGSLRREPGGKLTKKEKKAAKRQRQAGNTPSRARGKLDDRMEL